MRYKSGWARNYNKDNFKKRISGYFGETRDVLVNQHKSNLKRIGRIKAELFKSNI